LRFEQFTCSRQQRGRNRSVEMGLATLLIRKSVDDRERRPADRYCEPSDGVRLVLDEWERVTQKCGSSSNLSGFRRQTDDQSSGDHHLLLFWGRPVREGTDG
jgi:hypothetical protein